MTPGRLDLRAVEARLNATEVCYECRADMQALLAHGRALRAALHECVDAATEQGYTLLPREKAAIVSARAVLDAAGDAAGAAPEETHP